MHMPPQPQPTAMAPIEQQHYAEDAQRSMARTASPVNAATTPNSDRDRAGRDNGGGASSPASTSSELSYKSTSPRMQRTSVRAILSSLSSAASSPTGGSGQSPQKKRRRDEDFSPLKLLQQAKPAPARTGPPLTATHEIRYLRKEVAEMEEQLAHLETKWVESIPTEPVLASACRAAREKWTTTQVEQVNSELRDQLTQQQFIFASLQSAILQAPLQSSCREMYEAIHLDTHLSTDEAERLQELQVHCDKGIALVPGVIQRFTSHIASSPTPFSQTNITGGVDHTYVSNVFVLELPHSSLTEVFHATLGYYAQLPLEMQRCVATKMEIKPLNLLSKLRQYAKVKFTNELFPTTVNTTFSAKVVDGVAVIHSDGIVHDALHPIPADEDVNRIGINALTITPVTDASTGKVSKVVVRRILLYRYSLLPHHPLVQKDMKLNQCVINGDLLTALICQNLQQQKPELIEQVAAGHYPGVAPGK